MNDLLFWEDFTPGQTLDLGARTVSADEIIAFGRDFDPQPFHVDAEAAQISIFGGLIASGWHSAALLMRLMCDSYLLRSASLGSPGVEQIRWLRPVRPGDTLRGRMTVLKARASQSKPDRGVVNSLFELFNQHDELVMTMEGMGMFKKRTV
jgi:acyl dehydratase